MGIFKPLDLIPDGSQLLLAVAADLLQGGQLVYTPSCPEQLHLQLFCSKIRQLFALVGMLRREDHIGLAFIDRMGAEVILNAGIAGGMNHCVHVCDIVIANEVMSHDVNPEFLVKYPPHCAVYPCDQALQERTAQICDRLGIRHHKGRIVSGEAFISSNEIKADICARMSPLAVDMESSAVGQCAYRNQVPFLSIRCISDNADDAGDKTSDEFEKVAAKQVADVVLALVEESF